MSKEYCSAFWKLPDGSFINMSHVRRVVPIDDGHVHIYYAGMGASSGYSIESKDDFDKRTVVLECPETVPKDKNCLCRHFE